jgi:alpha-soluble NSF attachment protein
MFQLSTIIHSSTANACYKDAADLHGELENYPAAIARYEQVANASLNSALTKYSVKEYWLRAGLCALAMGVSDVVRNAYNDAQAR